MCDCAIVCVCVCGGGDIVLIAVCGTLIILIILLCDKRNKYVMISTSSLLFYDDITVFSVFITMVTVRPFCWWGCVCSCIVLLTIMYSLFYEPAMTTTKLLLVG